MTKVRTGGRPRVGSTYEKRGVRVLSITTDRPGARKPRYTTRCPANDDGSPATPTEARIAAAKMQRAYDRGEWDPWKVEGPAAAPEPSAPAETVRAWCGRWIAARVAMGLRVAGEDANRLEGHVYPLLGEVPVAAVTRAQLEDVRDALDAKTRAGDLATATATRIWAVVSKAFRDACASKDRSLRVRDDNPCASVEPPDRGAEKAGAYLYPSELLAVVACPRVHLHLRRIFALAVYTYARAGELQALEWDSVDLERGIVHIHQASDRVTGGVRETKTKVTRRFALEPGILPLLRAMHAESGGRGRVVPVMPTRSHGARYLRAALKAAGVTRAELFARSKTRRHIDFHDLRATGITWLAIRGDEPLRIMQRAGHTNFATTQRYVREAENLRGEAFGAVFPVIPVDGAVPPASAGSATALATATPQSARMPGDSAATRRSRSALAVNGAVEPSTKLLANQSAGEGSGAPVRIPADGSATGSATAVAARFDAKRVARETREAMARETEAGWSL